MVYFVRILIQMCIHKIVSFKWPDVSELSFCAEEYFVVVFSLSFEKVSTDNLCLNVSDNVVIEVSNVALSSCSVELLSQPCRNNVCAQGTVTLTAVTDFTRDGNRASFLSIQPAEGSPRLWRGYNPPALKVSEILACISKFNISRLSGFVLN